VASSPAVPKSSKPVSALDSLRARTNYAPKRYSGYAPIPVAALAEIPRLSSGAACTHLLLMIFAHSVGERVKETEAFQETTGDLTTAQLVEECHCDERTIQREILGLAQRKLITYTQRKKGIWRITLLFRNWASLPDYKPGPTLEPGVEETAAEDQDATAKAQTVTRLTDKPISVRAGGASRKLKIPVGVSDIWCKSNLDIHFEAVIQGGSLLVNFIGPQFKAQAGNGLLKQQGIQDNNRHTRRVEHPRAAEVERLFDPLMLGIRGGRSLSGDAICFQQACEALGDVDHDYLVHYVNVRAKRDISSPKAAVGICRDVARDWQKSKNLPPAKRAPKNLTREDIDALIAKEEADAAQKRRRA
jgi:hypothetical protein